MNPTYMWTDKLGHQIRVGDFIAYGVARANISVAVVYEVNTNNIKIKWPDFKTDWAVTPPRPIGWKTRKSTLTTTDIVVLPIERIIKIDQNYGLNEPGLEDQFRRIQHEILNGL